MYYGSRKRLVDERDMAFDNSLSRARRLVHPGGKATANDGDKVTLQLEVLGPAMTEVSF